MVTETLRPYAVGDSNDNAPVGAAENWDCVEEVTSDSDTTYVRSGAATLAYLDLYNIDVSAIPLGSTINSVLVYMRVRSENSTYRATFRAALKKSGAATQYGTVKTPTTSYTLYSQSFTGVTQADLDALQIGVEITTVQNELTYRGRCTQVYVVIDYTEPTVGIASKRLLVGVGV